MHVALIGGTGHVGTYLVPRLVAAGHEVSVITRGRRDPCTEHAAWKRVRYLVIDRETTERRGQFAPALSELDPDVVIDLICFSKESAEHLVEALRGRICHYLACGTIWVHGHSEQVPTREEAPKRPFGDYGVKKAEMEAYLLNTARRDGFPATVIHPGHIVGRGWAPLNPEGHFDTRVWSDIRAGRSIRIPNLGLETVHHVHADDVARLFMRAMERWSTSVGESFHAVSPQALTLRGFADAAYRWFDQSPAVELVPWETLKAQVSEHDAAFIWDHIAHSPNCSMAKAERLLGFTPRYSSLEAVYESVTWLVDRGDLA
jgi:nucleoside-diphosphate-sugar epimerase